MTKAKYSSDAASPVEVSERMVSAGLAVLRGSGVVEGQLGSDGLLVAEIFRAMLAARLTKGAK